MGFNLNEKVVLTSPVVPHSYDSFHQDLQKLCEDESVVATGLDSCHIPHSFRASGLSVMANSWGNQAFIQKAAYHKRLESMQPYMNPNTPTALCTSDLLCANKDGWGERLVRCADSLDPFLCPS